MTYGRRRGLLPAGAAWLLVSALMGCSGPEAEAPAAPEEAAPVVVPPAADSDDGRAAMLARAASEVDEYWAKARLIRVGPRALPPLLAQATSSDEALAAESEGAVRWIVQRWKTRPDATELMTDELVAYTRRDIPAARREFAVDLLGDLGGNTAVARLVELLPDDELGETAVLALGRIEGATARDALIAEAGRSPDHRSAVWAALGRRGEPESIPVLLEAAASDDDALKALAGFDEPAVTSWLIDSAAGGSEAAARAFVASDAALDGALMARLLASTSGEAREIVLAAIRAPEQYDEALVAALLDVPTRGETGRARSRALLGLAERMDPATAARVAMEALEDHRDASVVVPALAVCATRCPPDAASEIADRLDSRDPTVRHAAVQALGELRGGQASAVLFEAIRRASPEAARPMIEALGQRSDGAAVQSMLQLMAEPREGTETDLHQAALLMAPELSNWRHAAQIWAGSLDLAVTTEALQGLERSAGAAELARIEAILSTSGGEIYEAARSALAETGRRLAQGGERDAGARALRTAFDEGADVGRDLRSLGERVELVAHGGYVDAWWRLVPTTNDGPCNAAPPPAGAIETSGADGSEDWRSIEAGSARGAISLGNSDPRSPVWLVTDIVPREAAAVGLTIQSPATVDAWLDGEPLTAVEGSPEGDLVFSGRVRDDASRLVLRLCNADPGTALTVRLEDDTGRPLKFRIR